MTKEQLLAASQIIQKQFKHVLSRTDNAATWRGNKISPEGLKIYNGYAREFNKIFEDFDLFLFPEHKHECHLGYPLTEEVLSQIEIAIGVLSA